jgi:leucyl/phenylalanyl-tRNA--protein transferase
MNDGGWYFRASPATMVALVPIEPPPTRWQLPNAESADEHGLVGLGADLEPGTLLAAYRSGTFPMPITGLEPMAWWSPDPRGVLPLAGLRVTKSLARSTRRFELRVDTAFDAVVAACAEPSRRGGWISEAIARAYDALHDLGWAHSVEAWSPDEKLVGGLYGVAIGGLFAGESMFHRAPDASKVALVGLAERLGPDALLDVQWRTPHLASLGAVEIPRAEYLARLSAALQRPLPEAFA